MGEWERNSKGKAHTPKCKWLKLGDGWVGVHCKIILLCCMFEIFHSIKYLISRRMRDEVNMRKYPKASDLGCRHRQDSRLPFLTPTHGKPQPGRGYWAAAPPLGCLVCDPGAWGWPGERRRGGQAQDSLGHTSKGCNSISVLSHASFPHQAFVCAEVHWKKPPRTGSPAMGLFLHLLFQLWPHWVQTLWSPSFSCWWWVTRRASLWQFITAPAEFTGYLLVIKYLQFYQESTSIYFIPFEF